MYHDKMINGHGEVIIIINNIGDRFKSKNISIKQTRIG